MKISITGSKISGNSKVLNDAKLNNNSEIELKGVEISGNAEILNRLDMSEVIDEIRERLSEVDTDSAEYKQLKMIAYDKYDGNNERKEKILKHLMTFSGGILQNIIANMLTR